MLILWCAGIPGCGLGANNAAHSLSRFEMDGGVGFRDGCNGFVSIL